VELGRVKELALHKMSRSRSRSHAFLAFRGEESRDRGRDLDKGRDRDEDRDSDREEEEEEEEREDESVEQEEHRSTHPSSSLFDREREGDLVYPRAGPHDGQWVAVIDHERHIRALSDQLKSAEETAMQSLDEWQGERREMEEDMLQEKVRCDERERRAEVEKEELLCELNAEREKSKALRALLEVHTGEALGYLHGEEEGGEGKEVMDRREEREREKGSSWDTALFTDSTLSTERIGAGVNTDYVFLKETYDAQLAVFEDKIVKRDESLKVLVLECKTKDALLLSLTMGERAREKEEKERVREKERAKEMDREKEIEDMRADSDRVQEAIFKLQKEKEKNKVLLDRIAEEEGRYAILEGHRDQNMETFRVEKNDLRTQLSCMMREMTKLRSDVLDREREGNERCEAAEERVEEAVRERKEVVKGHEKAVKALNEEHRVKELKVRLLSLSVC
jgi:hypothetical protein